MILYLLLCVNAIILLTEGLIKFRPFVRNNHGLPPSGVLTCSL